MRLIAFRVTNYRNIIDSGWVDVERVTAIVGQNEGGKSNLCEALYRLNPFEVKDEYSIDEDWPADDWGGRDRMAIVCQARFEITDRTEILALFGKESSLEEQGEGESEDEDQIAPKPPDVVILLVTRNYEGTLTVTATTPDGQKFDGDELHQWVIEQMPKFVYIRDYELSGSQTELDQLASRQLNVPWSELKTEEQTLLIVLKLAAINIKDFLAKGNTPQGRTLRSFDKRQASAYLTAQFSRLWKQKQVRFDIDIDNTTLNIFVEDIGLGMPVRLSKRSTGFRWYVAFAWKFTHASKGDYKNCILLLEEPGIHLHHAGHRDLLELFEELAGVKREDKPGWDNTIIYTTHLATMLDESYPERVRIVEVENHHSKVVNGMVSSQRTPMMVIESRLGLAGGMSGLLGNRQTLIVEGGDDAIILQKLSGVLSRSDREGLSERIYLFPAQGASKTPMYAGFLVGHEWDAGVLLDSDEAGEKARKKISELYLKEAARNSRFRVLMLGQAAGISQTDAAIEDLFPCEFYLDCVNSAYGLAIQVSELPQDGSTMITKRVEHVLQTRFGMSKLDKGLLMNQLLKRFNGWTNASQLPAETADRSEKLFKSINQAFTSGTQLPIRTSENKKMSDRRASSSQN
jgi:hypothetical protein